MTYILKVAAERFGRRRQWLLLSIIIMLIFLGGWVVWFGSEYLTNIVTYKMVTFFAPSFLLLAGLYWIRWWATKPPRTWMDTIEQEKN
jgi:heme A synthase